MSGGELSDEYLNAFADDQLNAEEKLEMMNALRRDEGLRQRVYDIRNLKDLVKASYESAPGYSRETKTAANGLGRIGMAVAASILLAVGSVAGWFLSASLNGQMWRTEAGSEDRYLKGVVASESIENHTRNVILHINRGDPNTLKAVLDTAEAILLGAEAGGGVVQVEIIANADGLTLFRTDKSPFAVRIARMRKQYGALTFMVCGFAAERSGKREKRFIGFLPEVVVAPSAVERIVMRVKQGWKYIRI